MTKPNIILITLDALRADHLGIYGCKKNTSPFIDSLANKGVVFKNAFSVGAATPQSFVGIMTSTYPLDFGGYSRLSEERTLVSEVFQKAGYKTMGFHSNAYLSEYFGYGRGWDVFRYLNHFKGSGVSKAMQDNTWQARLAKKIFNRQNRALGHSNFLYGRLMGFFESIITTLRKMYLNIVRPIPPYYTAFEINDAVKGEIKGKQDKPVFLWVHYMDAHDPYGLFLRKGKKLIPKIKSYFFDYLMTFFGEYPGVNRLFSNFYIGMYDEGIRNIDRALKELFKHLSQTEVLNDKTAVFITADHGEEFADHGGFIHMQKAFNENIRVPLVISGPKELIGTSGEKEIARSLIDLAPTMFFYSGISQPRNFRGNNIFDGEERDVFAELSNHEADLSGIRPIAQVLVSGGYKLIRMNDRSLLFPTDDRKEEKNLFGQDKEIDSVMENKLRKIRHL